MTVLGLDIGTTTCKCVAFDEAFNVVCESIREYSLIHTDKHVEQNPEIWWDAVVETVHEVLPKSGVVTGIGISSQGITFVPVDINGQALINALTWLDMRATHECSAIENHFSLKDIFNITGKRINPAYTLPKLMWLKANMPDIYNKTYKFLMTHDYIINRLCSAFITEESLAAGTMAYDISKKTWDENIMGSTGIDIEKFPKVVQSGTIAGRLTKTVANELGLSTEVVVYTGGQDQKCAAYAAGISKDIVTVSLGTSSAITAMYEKPIFTNDMSLPCFPFIDGQNWVLEGFGSTAGASVKWYRDNLVKDKSYKEIDQLIEAGYEKISNVIFFPYLGGTASPEWYGTDGGGFLGLKLDTNEIDMARAVLESVAFTIKANIDRMEAVGRNYDKISIFGSGAYSDIWLRIIADVTGKSIVLPVVRQMACLGAALKCGDFKYEVKVEKIYNPDLEKTKYYKSLYKKYKMFEKKIYGGDL